MLTDFLDSVSLQFRTPITDQAVFDIIEGNSLPSKYCPPSQHSNILNLHRTAEVPAAESLLVDAKLKIKKDKNAPLSAGDGWYNMTAPQMTAELEMDRELIRLRGQFDPQRKHYRVPKKKEHSDQVFQVGTVIPTPFEQGSVSSSTTQFKNKANSRTVDALLKDASLKEVLKRKYDSVQITRKRVRVKRAPGYHKRKF
ncbi:hypothetical protein RCL1_002412 [Eukaryota sp. TZLM3-RCL]